MRFLVCCSLTIAALGISGAAVAQAGDRPQAVIAAFREATGGVAWDRLEGCYEQGSHNDGAATYQTWFSFRRYGLRIESGSGEPSARVMGFNGSYSWQTNPSGSPEVRRDAHSLAEAITTTYLSSNGYFFPDRFPAAFVDHGEATLAHRVFDVIEITPEGGYALDYWFDRETHLLNRVVDRRRSDAAITVEASDYQQADGIAVPFSLVMSGPEGQVLNRGRVASLTCHPTDAALYDGLG